MTRWSKNVTLAAVQRDLLESIGRELAALAQLRRLLGALGQDDKPRAETIADVRRWLETVDGQRPPRPEPGQSVAEIHEYLVRMADEALATAEGPDGPGDEAWEATWDAAIRDRMAQAATTLGAHLHVMGDDLVRKAIDAAALRVARLEGVDPGAGSTRLPTYVLRADAIRAVTAGTK